MLSFKFEISAFCRGLHLDRYTRSCKIAVDYRALPTEQRESCFSGVSLLASSRITQLQKRNYNKAVSVYFSNIEKDYSGAEVFSLLFNQC